MARVETASAVYNTHETPRSWNVAKDSGLRSMDRPLPLRPEKTEDKTYDLFPVHIASEALGVTPREYVLDTLGATPEFRYAVTQSVLADPSGPHTTTTFARGDYMYHLYNNVEPTGKYSVQLKRKEESLEGEHVVTRSVSLDGRYGIEASSVVVFADGEKYSGKDAAEKIHNTFPELFPVADTEELNGHQIHVFPSPTVA